MAKFDITALLQAEKDKNDVALSVTWQIKMIPIDKLLDSSANFYGLRDIEELAASIETMGLQQNLDVRPVATRPEDVQNAASGQVGSLGGQTSAGSMGAGYYEILSGHRRVAACKMLRDGGSRKYDLLPCKVERIADDTLAELYLLYANASTRTLTDWEKATQAAKIMDLLKQAKEAGKLDNFGGRLRDLAAQLLHVSPAQVGRLEKINRDLPEDDKAALKSGEIGITEAYDRAANASKPKEYTVVTQPGTATWEQGVIQVAELIRAMDEDKRRKIAGAAAQAERAVLIKVIKIVFGAQSYSGGTISDAQSRGFHFRNTSPSMLTLINSDDRREVHMTWPLVAEIARDMAANGAFGALDGGVPEAAPPAATQEVLDGFTLPEDSALIGDFERRLNRLGITTRDEHGLRTSRDIGGDIYDKIVAFEQSQGLRRPLHCGGG